MFGFTDVRPSLDNGSKQGSIDIRNWLFLDAVEQNDVACYLKAPGHEGCLVIYVSSWVSWDPLCLINQLHLL